jgi:hypothetical protein
MSECVWTEDSEGNWMTGCKELYVIITGTPEENRMRFCVYCGKPIRQQLYKESYDCPIHGKQDTEDCSRC